MPRTLVRRPAIAGAVLVAALLSASLSGCSVVAPEGKVQSCLALQGPLTTAGGKLQTALSNAQQHPQGAVDTLKEVHGDLEGPFSKIKNPEVKAKATAANDALAELTTTLESSLADPLTADATALQESGTATQTAFTDLVTECTPQSQ